MIDPVLSPSVLAIVVTYNGELWIRKCVSSLLNSTLPPKIVVVDNGSTDKTTTIIRIEFPGVTLIETQSNLGFGRANNIGIEHGVQNNFEFFFLLNQDAWVEPLTIEQLVKAQQNNPEFGVLSPVHLNGKGDLWDYKFFDYVCESSQRQLISDLFLRKEMKEVYPVRFINAAAWLLSAKCVKQVGGFDPLFAHYGEDNNYVGRLSVKKLKLGVVPWAVIFHDREERTRSGSSCNVAKEYRLLLIKYTDPAQVFGFLPFFKELLRLTYRAIKALFMLRFRLFSCYMQLIAKFSMAYNAIRKNRETYVKEYPFIKLKPE